jgi:hypothetical protein
VKKTLAAVTAGLLLVAGQAAASQNTAAVRVNDRIGAPVGESSEFAGAELGGIVLAVAAIAFVIAGVSNDDDSDSD